MVVSSVSSPISRSTGFLQLLEPPPPLRVGAFWAIFEDSFSPLLLFKLSPGNISLEHEGPPPFGTLPRQQW